MTIFLIVALGLLYISTAALTFCITHAAFTFLWVKESGWDGKSQAELAVLPALIWPITLPVVLCIVVLALLWCLGGWIRGSFLEWKKLLPKGQRK